MISDIPFVRHAVDGLNFAQQLAIHTAYFANAEFAGELLFLAEAYLADHDVDVWYIMDDGTIHTFWA
jgi:hypothetical protein